VVVALPAALVGVEASGRNVARALGTFLGELVEVAVRLLVSGSTRTVRDLAGRYPDVLGHLLTPRNRNSVASLLATGLPWGADNGAFSGFEPALFRRFLRRVGDKPRCLFLAAPDVVGQAGATLARFREWREALLDARQPIALVGQDGAESLHLPWDEFDAWFIGGSTRWKLSQASADLAHEAKRRGKHVHMGRCNSLRRLEAAHGMGCDSADGSSASMFGDKYIGQFCGWLRQLARQRHLFLGEP
jgi:hypothetical protein